MEYLLVMLTAPCKILMLCTAWSFTAFFSAASQAQCIRSHLFDEEAIDATLFGSSVSVDGDILVVGAMLDTGVEWGSGRLHVYDRNGAVWSKRQVLEAPDGDLTDMLGSAVDIDGGTIIAGAWWDEENGLRSGSAYIFEDSGEGDFTFAGKLTASDGLPEATFGRTVAVSGSFAVVGAPLHGADGAAAGSVYLFERGEDGTWSQTRRIVHDELAAGDRFGISLDLDGTQLAVGSSWADQERGRVDLYEIGSGGVVTRIDTLQPPAIDPGDQFGFDVALEGDQLVAGAYLDDEAAVDGGSAWFYEKVGGTWTLAQGPVVDDFIGGEGAQLGVSVDIHGGIALIGARFATREGTPVRSGGVMVCLNFRPDWQTSTYLLSDRPQTDSEFGWQVGLDRNSTEDGTYAVVSALYEEVTVEDDGAAYIFDLNDEFCGGNEIGDLNQDGIVDGADLTMLLGAWGACSEPSCAADINQDGIIDGADLTLLLGSWS